jgi:hypothetical protein
MNNTNTAFARKTIMLNPISAFDSKLSEYEPDVAVMIKTMIPVVSSWLRKGKSYGWHNNLHQESSVQDNDGG